MYKTFVIHGGLFLLSVLAVLILFYSDLFTGEESNKTEASLAYLYIGSYSASNGDGIYIYQMNRETGELQFIKSVKAVNPSFLTIHPDKKFLYAVNETQEFQGQAGGAVSAFAIDSQSGDLSFLNQQPTYGSYPCHLSIDKSGKYLLAANYGGGNIAVFPLQKDGSIGKATDNIQHTGKGFNPQRQEAPHTHSVNMDAAGKFVFAADLGLDKVMIYKLDNINGKLVSNDPPFLKTAAGAGPRHFTFHPNGKFAFLINELNSTITSCAYDAQPGALTEIHSVSTLPLDYNGNNSCAEVQVSPDGRFVYGSNRGHNSIAIFACDAKTGHLSLCGHESTRGKTPRNFAIDPTGVFLLAANQNSNDIFVFRINHNDGALEFTGYSASVPSPVCIKFLR